TLVHHFAGAGNLWLLDVLLRRGADVNAKNEDRVAPLHLAAYQGHLDVVQALPDFGADINAVDRYTVLHLASWQGYIPIVEYLLAHRADPLRKTSTGDTALNL
ncbi:ankyrin repeat domain-containing protein, partial [Aspergillus homomorphus CBS 101889]